jgi:hypothetical protein
MTLMIFSYSSLLTVVSCITTALFDTSLLRPPSNPRHHLRGVRITTSKAQSTHPTLSGILQRSLAHVFFSLANMALEHTRVVGACVHKMFWWLRRLPHAPRLLFLGGSRTFPVWTLKAGKLAVKKKTHKLASDDST